MSYKYLQAFFLSLNLFLVAGCGAFTFVAPVATGVVYWVQGEAHKYYEEDMETLHKAAQETFRELNLPIKKDELKKDIYVMTTGDKDRFAVKIEPHNDKITELSIRVNFMGDKDFAELIYKKIDAKVD